MYSAISCAYPIIKETVPKSSLGYGTNNKYPEFPPLMTDGRSVIGSWQPESTENANLIESNGIKTNWQYRQFLMKNAQQIQEYNFRETCNDVGYFKRPIDLPSIQSNAVSGQGLKSPTTNLVDDHRSSDKFGKTYDETLVEPYDSIYRYLEHCYRISYEGSPLYGELQKLFLDKIEN